MTRRRTLLLVAFGSLASIATSKIDHYWEQTDKQELQPAMITADRASLRYKVRAELHGPGPFNGLDGYISAAIQVDPAPDAITVELRSLTHPDEPVISDRLLPEYNYLTVDMAAWLACTADPCVEEVEVTIKRDATPVTFTVSGTITAEAHDLSKEEPPNTAVVVTVEGPLP